MCEGQTFEFLLHPREHRSALQAVTVITLVTVADFPSGMVRAGAWPRNEGGPQPPAPPLLETASPYDRSGSGWGQNAVGARSASSDETLRLARWQDPSPRALSRLPSPSLAQAIRSIGPKNLQTGTKSLARPDNLSDNSLILKACRGLGIIVQPRAGHASGKLAQRRQSAGALNVQGWQYRPTECLRSGRAP
jgi:hypothetical protein